MPEVDAGLGYSAMTNSVSFRYFKASPEIILLAVIRMRGFPNWRWRLDEVFVMINGDRHHLWRVVGCDGEGLERDRPKHRDRKAPFKFIIKSMMSYGKSEGIVTD